MLYAAARGNVGHIRKLLNAGVLVDVQDGHTSTKPCALHLAAINDHEEVTMELLEAGARLNIVTDCVKLLFVKPSNMEIQRLSTFSWPVMSLSTSMMRKNVHLFILLLNLGWCRS